jgi:hypothetical protein
MPLPVVIDIEAEVRRLRQEVNELRSAIMSMRHSINIIPPTETQVTFASTLPPLTTRAGTPIG